MRSETSDFWREKSPGMQAGRVQPSRKLKKRQRPSGSLALSGSGVLAAAWMLAATAYFHYVSGVVTVFTAVLFVGRNLTITAWMGAFLSVFVCHKEALSNGGTN